MSAWFWWVCGSLFVVLAVVQIVGNVYCIVFLHRKWRKAPELWGTTWVDIVLRVEQQFGVRLEEHDFADWTPEARWSVTAGEVWAVVVAKISPDRLTEGWPQFTKLLRDVFCVRADQISESTRLHADLGLQHDF